MPLDSVVSEVLNIYEMYDYYIDGAGFNKQNFFELLESTINDSDSLEDFKKLIDETENLKVTAFRANLGEGSAVLIVIISKDHINMIAFSNIYDPSSIQTGPFRKDKFERWFKSLLN
ncbi:hypothetical protein JCM15548_14629 [Geofilum rubicundum JCM 15548]|uniref:Uncharacterized protein n=1 Tax=Geofilum rubicundum JCM 15548 TaxID=1236989 RepID=A0A0E9LR54_9BACT|nr:hypothetical protein JCM15548_14629 [Geofilum rubicundum JCM 15548]